MNQASSSQTPGFSADQRSLIELSAMGFRDTEREIIDYIGAEVLVARGGEALAKVMPGRRKVRELAAQHRKKLEALSTFVARGHTIFGLQNSAELGPLRRVKDMPLLAFGRGQSHLLYASPTVAIVGPREPSPRGLKRAKAMASLFAEHGFVVVSGGARGIDFAAHQAALLCGGQTIIVQGVPLNPLDDERPERILELVDSGPDRVLTLTDCGPWVDTKPYLFAKRNRLIAALSDAVIVIEGRAGSGAGITAKEAGRLGVPVFAMPGSLDDELSDSPNRLIAEGDAQLLFDVDAVFKVVGQGAPQKADKSSTKPRQKYEGPHRSTFEGLVALGGSASADALARELGMGIALVLAALTDLELEGVVLRQGSAFVVKAD